MPALPLTAVFAALPDPRRETGNKLHRLTDILSITTCAVIGGAVVGGGGRVRPDQGGVLPPVPQAGQRHPQLGHLRPGVRQAGPKGTTPAKRLKAGWDDDDLLKVLNGLSAP